jgi:hypothetical protein
MIWNLIGSVINLLGLVISLTNTLQPRLIRVLIIVIVIISVYGEDNFSILLSSYIADRLVNILLLLDRKLINFRELINIQTLWHLSLLLSLLITYQDLVYWLGLWHHNLPNFRSTRRVLRLYLNKIILDFI